MNKTYKIEGRKGGAYFCDWITKKDIKELDSIAYISALGGLDIKGFEYGIDDRLAVVSGAWTGCKGVHLCRIYHSFKHGDNYIILDGYRLSLSDMMTI